jgi:hypothetical protein
VKLILKEFFLSLMIFKNKMSCFFKNCNESNFFNFFFREGSFVVSFPFEEASKSGKEILKNINLLNSLLEESNLKIGDAEVQSKISLNEISKNIKEALESKTIY